MKTRLLPVIFFFSLIIFAYTIQAQTFTLKQSHENGIYKSGDKIRVTAYPINNGKSDTLWVKVFQNNTKIILQSAIIPVTDSVAIFESSFKKSCSVIVEAKMKGNKQMTGMIVDPQKIKPGTAYPKDLKKYWDAEKQALKALTLDVKFGKNECQEFDFVCFDTEINCTGPKPARGYFARPTKAAPKSLPIVLLVHAAGVKGSWCKSDPKEAIRYAKMGKGAMCFDLNAHGMLDGQPDEYYNDLEAGELKNYYISGIESRENIYFRGTVPEINPHTRFSDPAT